MSFLCRFSFFAFILENYFRSAEGVWGSVRASLGTQGIWVMWLSEGTGARKAPAEGCRSCWEDSAATSVWGHVPGYPVSQGVAILCHTLGQTFCPLCLASSSIINPQCCQIKTEGGKCHVCHPPTWASESSSVLSPTSGLAAHLSLWPDEWCLSGGQPGIFSLTLQGVRPYSSGVELQSDALSNPVSACLVQIEFFADFTYKLTGFEWNVRKPIADMNTKNSWHGL